MNCKLAWLAVACLLPLPFLAQTASLISMDQEPHHHLALQNNYVKVFDVRVSPGDSIMLHRHDQDAVAIAIGEQLVTVDVPGNPDIQQKNEDAQVSLQRGGYVHSTRIDGSTPYHTVAVELLHPQTNFQNVCAVVLAGEPQNCPDPSTSASTFPYDSQTLIESGETQVRIVRVPRGQRMTIGDLQDFELVVALDAAKISQPPGKVGPDQSLQPGNFVWLANGGPSRLFKNNGKAEARFILLSFHPI